ncbi:DUF2878 domain-containing protein [Vibrio atypicus]|uniref:DUF2878 domain-containing protein n=1 Tax=Vibrio atypicus TaxID=558271 RepID=UPI0013595FF8|nr:DUF2878 domain-containing protein [Vibrio atypicus]
MKTSQLILISTWFQILWFMAILGTEKWQWVTLSLVVFTIVVSAKYGALRLDRLLLLFIIGLTIDHTNTFFGLFEFLTAGFPIWLAALWGIFLWYANYLVPILNRYPFWAVSIVTGLSGALSYFAGMKLGAVQFPFDFTLTFMILFAEWALMIIVIKRVYRYEYHATNIRSGARH